MVELNEENLEDTGCYCLRSKPVKYTWLKGKFPIR